jgi:hypothetical protein
MTIPRFRCLPRQRRGEFGFGIYDRLGSEVDMYTDEEKAQRVTDMLNANELTEEKLAAVESACRGESIRLRQLDKYRSAIKARIA